MMIGFIVYPFYCCHRNVSLAHCFFKITGIGKIQNVVVFLFVPDSILLGKLAFADTTNSAKENHTLCFKPSRQFAVFVGSAHKKLIGPNFRCDNVFFFRKPFAQLR